MAENYISKALTFAEKAHCGQFRKDGKPYFSHVKAVAHKVLLDWFQLIPREAQDEWNRHKDHVVAAAALHDTIEDCGVTTNQLLHEGFSPLTVEIVDMVSKKKGETYFDFVMRLNESHPFKTGAVAVKLADIEDNLKDCSEGSLKDKYRLSKYILSYFNRVRGNQTTPMNKFVNT